MIVLLRKICTVFVTGDLPAVSALLVATFVGAIFEAVGVGIVLPLINGLNNPDQIKEYGWVLDYLGLAGYWKTLGPEQLVFLTILCALLIFLLKNSYLLLLTYFQYRFAFQKQIALGVRFFKIYTGKPYEFFFERNSMELLRNITVLIPSVIQGLLMPLITLMTELMVVACILGVLIVYDWFAASIMGISFSSVSLCFYLVQRVYISRAGRDTNIEMGNMLTWSNQAFSGTKIIKAFGCEGYFLGKYYDSGRRYSSAARKYYVLAQAPKYIIEFLAVFSIAVFFLVAMLRPASSQSFLPLFALYGMAAFRLMPSFNRILGQLTSLRYYANALDELLKDCCPEDRQAASPRRQPSPGLTFKQNITFSGVHYSYPKCQDEVLAAVTFSIPRGSSVALVGASGSGKTTLVDILLGIIRPTKGQVLVDGVDVGSDLPTWRRLIGYVPQETYLIDGTLQDNIAFGVGEAAVDSDRVAECIKAVQLYDFVQTLPGQLKERVGENGIRLSGGQRQRIGIARALYFNPEILVFDEATSALDNDTEKALTEAIDKIGEEKTIFIIAHRLSTIEKCSAVYEISDGKLKRLR